MRDRKGLLPDFIPQRLVEDGLLFHFSMAHQRPDNIAWRKGPAIEVIEILTDHACAILGGDVLVESESDLSYSGDFWDLVDEDVVLWEDYVEYTRERSIRTIEEFDHKRGGSCVYVIFYLDEPGYKEQLRNFGNIRYR